MLLLLAHIALEMPVTGLARELGLDPDEIAARVARTLATLWADEDMIAQIEGIHQAGDSANYHPLIFSIQLQDWFCSNCGTFGRSCSSAESDARAEPVARFAASGSTVPTEQAGKTDTDPDRHAESDQFTNAQPGIECRAHA